jgi:hypothetical protein
MARKAALIDTVFIVPKSPIRRNKIVAGPKTWVAIDGKAHRRGNGIAWRVADTKPHVFKVEPPAIIVPGSLRINGNEAAALIKEDAKAGYYEYTMTVDGKFVEGGSAPGIIID